MEKKERRKSRSRSQGDLGKSNAGGDDLVYGRKEYEDGIYEGFFKDGLRHGKGLMKRKNGFVFFEGSWESDKANGYGITKYPHKGSRHEGNYKDGKRDGLGVFLWANGDKYSGHFKEGLMHGYGRFEWAMGDVYNRIEGLGFKTYVDGRKSIGSFKNSEENGWVKQIYPNGDYFSGFIADNQIDQFGCYQWMNGNRYEGEWKQDVLHGIGCYTNIEESAVGKVIITMEGTFKKGSLNGYGYCKNSKADYEYYGEVSDDKSVWGHFTYEDGMEYDGDTFHLTRHGVGQLSYTKTPLVLLDNAGDAEEINPFNIDHVNTFADLIESIQTYGGTYVGCFDRDIPHGSGDLFLMNQQYMMSFDHGIVRKL